VTCPCDTKLHPRELTIAPGLERLPRQIATFPDFRDAMLSAVGREPPLHDWRARHRDDLGVMLLEQWAYVCDALSFYDEVIAHECYLRTARLRPSLRKLVALLGYVPRPAVASSVRLAAFADGRTPATVPAGTQLRSGAFGAEPPQLFEVDAATVVHPLANAWQLEPPRPAELGTANPSTLLLDAAAAGAAPGVPVLVEVTGDASKTQVRRSAGTEDVEGADGEQYVRLSLSAALSLQNSTQVAALQLSRPTATASIWSFTPTTTAPTVIEHATDGQPTELVLDGIYREIKAGQAVVLEVAGQLRWFRLTEATDKAMAVTAEYKQGSGTNEVTFPAVKTPATKLKLDTGLNSRVGSPQWTANDASKLIVHYAFVDVGRATRELKTTLEPGDPLRLLPPAEQPKGGAEIKRLLLRDLDERGLDVPASITFSSRTVALQQGTTWSPPLALPVTAMGNSVPASRGERVAREVLGDGDASVGGQSFALQKSPLTYLPAPGAPGGVASTLVVWVDGVRWYEVPSFFGVRRDAQVYVVRQDDDQVSTVTFGDNQRGARLPTGRGNVVASYRFGAGATAPPAGSITQVAQPVDGLGSVENPVAASGGADQEAAESLRTFAPRSALTLGRAVSIPDLEAVAAAVPGARAVRAEWRWHDGRQRPLVQVWYVGSTGIEATISARLRAMSDPALALDVERATPVPTTLELDVITDPRRVPAEVLSTVRSRLMDPEHGLLAPERIGIGAPLYRSRIFGVVDGVPGALGVRTVRIGGASFSGFAVTPGAGKYFDVEQGGLVLSGGELAGE
jgi:hypothetical protein